MGSCVGESKSEGYRFFATLFVLVMVMQSSTSEKCSAETDHDLGSVMKAPNMGKTYTLLN